MRDVIIKLMVSKWGEPSVTAGTCSSRKSGILSLILGDICFLLVGNGLSVSVLVHKGGLGGLLVTIEDVIIEVDPLLAVVFLNLSEVVEGPVLFRCVLMPVTVVVGFFIVIEVGGSVGAGVLELVQVGLDGGELVVDVGGDIVKAGFHHLQEVIQGVRGALCLPCRGGGEWGSSCGGG